MVVLVGLTGVAGSGKGRIAKVLLELAAERGIRVMSFSLSDEIRLDLDLRGVTQDREAQKKAADSLRDRVGNSALAMLVASRIEDLIIDIDEPMLIVIDSIRNPDEVYELRSWFGERFRLIGVTASSEVLQSNIWLRNREDESRRLLNDTEAFESALRSEMGSGEPSYGHNVAGCLDMADWPPILNKGKEYEHEFEDDIKNLAEKWIFPLFWSSAGVSHR